MDAETLIREYDEGKWPAVPSVWVLALERLTRQFVSLQELFDKREEAITIAAETNTNLRATLVAAEPYVANFPGSPKGVDTARDAALNRIRSVLKRKER